MTPAPKLRRSIAGVLVGAALVLGCCGVGGWLFSIAFDVTRTLAREIDEEGRVINLGLAIAPLNASVDGGRWYRWEAAPLHPPGREAGYALSESEAAALTALHQQLGRQLGYRPVDGGTFMMWKRRDCGQSGDCYYRRIAEANAKDIEPLTRLFLEHGKDAGLQPDEVAAAVVTFIQAMEYRIPQGEPFGVHPPALVAADGWGDCDSKGLLAVQLLEGLGIDSVLLVSEHHAHAALGAQLPGEGFRVEHQGHSYLYWELTAPDWPPGKASPELQVAQLWRAVSLRAPPPPKQKPRR